MEPLPNQRWIGAGVIVLLAFVVAFVLAREGRKLGPGLTVWVTMGSAGPLTQGSKVQVAGLVIGSVEEVSFLKRQDDGARVTLRLWIDRRHAWMVHEGSEFFVNQPSLLSEPYLEVGVPVHGDPGPVVQDGAVVRGVDPSSIDRLLTRSYQALHELGDLLATDFPEAHQLGSEVAALEATLDTLAPAPRFDGYVRLADEIDATAEWIDVADPAAAMATFARARVLVDHGRASLAQLRSRIDRLSARLAEVRGQLDPALAARVDVALARVDDLAVQLDQLLASADSLIALIDRGEGSLAAFAQDVEIVDQVKDLTKVLKQQPWDLIGHPPETHR